MHLLRNESGWVAPGPRCLPHFLLYRPLEISEAAEVHDAAGPNVVYANGCTDLVARFREGLAPAALVSLSRITALRTIERRGTDLVIGAGVPHATGAADPLVRSVLPGLAEAWGRIATVRIRRRATIGGNLLARRPRYEMSILLDALRARLEFTHADGTVTSIRPRDVWRDRVPTGGLLTSVVIPDADSAQLVYDRSMRPLITVAVALHRFPDRVEGRLVTGSEYRPPHAAPFTVDAPSLPEARVAESAAQAAGTLPDSLGDEAASPAHRRRLATVLATRRLRGLAVEENLEEER